MEQLIAAVAELSKLMNTIAKSLKKTTSEKVTKVVAGVRSRIDHIRKTGRPKW